MTGNGSSCDGSWGASALSSCYLRLKISHQSRQRSDLTTTLLRVSSVIVHSTLAPVLHSHIPQIQKSKLPSTLKPGKSNQYASPGQVRSQMTLSNSVVPFMQRKCRNSCWLLKLQYRQASDLKNRAQVPANPVSTSQSSLPSPATGPPALF